MNLDFQEIKLLNRNFDFPDQINHIIIENSKTSVNFGVLQIQPDASQCQDRRSGGRKSGKGKDEDKLWLLTLTHHWKVFKQ